MLDALRCPVLFLVARFAQGLFAAPASTSERPPIFETLRDYDPAGRIPVDSNRVGQNRFANADLEHTGQDGNLAVWQTVGSATVTAKEARSGKHALRLENPTWPKADGRLLQHIAPVQGGASYRAAIHMRSPKGSRNVNIKLEVYTSEGEYLGGFRSEHFTISDSQGWVRVAYTHKLPPVPELRVTVLFRLWDPGPVLLDDASFGLVPRQPLHLSPAARGERLAQTPGLLAWTAPLPTRIGAHRAVDPAAARTWPAGRLRLRLAGNETGILPIFLSAGASDLEEVSLRIETGEAGPAEAYDLKLFTVEPFQYLGDLYYDVLVPAKPFALPSGSSKMVWLSVYMPPAAGRRALEGSLLVHRKGASVMRIPFAVHAFGFDLPREPSLPFSVGIPRPGRRVRPSERRQWLRDIARHRLSIRHLAAPKLRFRGDTPVADFTAFDAELDWAGRLGMHLFQLPWAYVATGHGAKYSQRYGPIDEASISDEFRRKFVNAMRVLGGHLEQKGVLNRFNHNLYDEPYPKHYAQLRELAALLKQANPRYRPSVYGVGRAAADGELAGIVEEPIGAAWDPEVRTILRRQGAIVTVYNPFQVFDVTRRPELTRGFAWWAWRCGMERIYHWCICPNRKSVHSQDYGNSWVFEHPGQDAFLSTVRFEMLREGLEDYDYLALFRRALDEAAEALGETNVDSAEIVDFFAAQLSERQIMKHCIDPARYERMRTFLGTAIEELPKPPRVFFRVRPGRNSGRFRLNLWAETGATIRVGSGTQRVLSDADSVEIAPDPTGMIDLVIAKDEHTKRLRLPVR